MLCSVSPRWRLSWTHPRGTEPCGPRAERVLTQRVGVGRTPDQARPLASGNSPPDLDPGRQDRQRVPRGGSHDTARQRDARCPGNAAFLSLGGTLPGLRGGPPRSSREGRGTARSFHGARAPRGGIAPGRHRACLVWLGSQQSSKQLKAPRGTKPPKPRTRGGRGGRRRRGGIILLSLHLGAVSSLTKPRLCEAPPWPRVINTCVPVPGEPFPGDSLAGVTSEPRNPNTFLRP